MSLISPTCLPSTINVQWSLLLPKTQVKYKTCTKTLPSHNPNDGRFSRILQAIAKASFTIDNDQSKMLWKGTDTIMTLD
ncbi:hypothetical protein AAZX31_04G108400 [Glycine max]